MGNRYTPETGYPAFDWVNRGEQSFSDDDIFVFVSGEVTLELTGKAMKDQLAEFRETERGKITDERVARIRPPLFTVLGNSTNFEESTRAFLGDSDLDVTELAPDAVQAFNEIQGLPE